MRKLFSLISVVLIMSGLTFGGVITVSSPAAGATFCPGDQIIIDWNEVPEESQDMKIRLWNGTMTAKVMNITATDVPNNGPYTWTVPTGLAQGQYTILVRSSTDLQIQGFSAVFTINTCSEQPQNSGLQATLFVSKPDLKVTIVSHPIKPAAHQETTIEFRIENIGKSKSKATVLRGYKANKLLQKWDVPALDPGILFSRQIKYTPPGVGWTLFTANVIQKWDVNQENNRAALKLFSIGPDLKITQIHTPNYKRTVWVKCKVRVTVKNIGIVASGRFDVDCKWTGAKKWQSKVCKNGLKPGESWTLDFTHAFGTIGMKKAVVHVNKNKNVSEENYENNKVGMIFHISVGNIIEAAAPETYNL